MEREEDRDGAGAAGVEDADIGRLFDALGDRTRRTIVGRLRSGPCSVTVLAQPLGITLTAVGQHLQILEECGLVRTEKHGRVRSCRLDPAGFSALEQWVREHRTEMETKLDRLGEVLAEGDGG